ncbi:MAG TPA: DUF5916 domain-containing protein [Longimicrobiales bacterium]|nr:DUF5916 domain-containing protein [Longimicrobiales bacterium]
MMKISDAGESGCSCRRRRAGWRPACRLLTALATLTGALASTGVEAQEGRESYQVPAVRVADRPQIDGDLSDSIWQTAALIDEFVQQEPNEGAPATERTEVRVLYTGSSLFIALHAFDSEPDQVIATEMRRDSNRILDEDNFQIILDTFMDSRSAYMFVVTPLAAQLDQQVFDEGGRDRRGSALAVNREWDGVWSVAARRTDDGWVAEIEIPMVTLRFPDADPQSWGINFMRDIRRKNEQVFWAPIPRAFSLTRVSLAGSLRDLESLDRGLDLRVKPYVTGGGRYQSQGGVGDTDANGDVGLDLKYGITASLNLDVTVNTDFAQAEVDNEQVNLTRFALFFPEKREFFLENANQFAVGTPNTLGRIADLFFSRRIGLTDTGAQVPILGGARITGKVGANNIAVMDIQTDDAFGQPSENFFVARYSRDLLGRSQIGGIVINKQATSGGYYNRTFAADMNLVPTAALTIDGFIAGTDTRGHEGSELAGHLRAGWLDQSWRIYSEYENFSNGFNPEVGFVPRVGMRRYKSHFEFNPRPGRWGIRMMEPMTNFTYVTDQSGRRESWQWHLMLGTRLENGAYLNFWHNQYAERIDQTFRVGGVPIDPGDYRFHDWAVMFNSDPSRRLFYRFSWQPQTFYGGDRTDYSATLGLRVTSQLATQASFSRNDVEIPNGEFTADVGSLQIDYAFSPTISLRSLTQYNSISDQFSTSARLRWIFRPGSDIYVVYDEVRRDTELLVDPFVDEFRDRQLIVKMTYLFSF